MKFTLFSTALAASAANAAVIGFNTGNTFTDGTGNRSEGEGHNADLDSGSVKVQSDYEAEFNAAKALAGTNGEFTSARLYTMIQGNTANTPIAAIPAAINTQTTLLLGLWASVDQAGFTNEVTALTSAINQYGTAFTDLIVGVSVGSEDLYRDSPTGIAANGYNGGIDPDILVNYIAQTKAALVGTAASGASVGHVDTWTAWVNSSNDAVISASDWLGMDAYPYFQNTIANSITVANSTFFEAYDNTVAVANGKSVWVTETGWPVSGPQENQAVASIENAQTYWKETGCALFGNINTWWYVLQDAAPTTPSPSFGIVGSDINSAPLYNLTCSNGNKPAASSSAASSAAATASSASAPASSAGPNTESIQASPAPETSPASVTLSQTTAAASSATSIASAAGSTVSAMTGMTTTVVAGMTSTIYQTTLVTITSCSDGCTSTAPETTTPVSSGTSAAPPVGSGSATTSAAPSGSACPVNLGGEYQYPHLIVPVNSAMPDKAYGTQYNGTISPTISTIFNFDIPQSYADKTCSLVFLLPDQAALETSAYTFNGQGGITVGKLDSAATAQTTYNTAKQLGFHQAGSVSSVKSGNSYVVSTSACAAGSRVAFEFESTGGLDLEYFQDYNPSPIGAYITAC